MTGEVQTTSVTDGSSLGQWHWCWPNPGPTPVNQTMDSEIFDGDRVPLSETVVREAIQNSLDARIAKDDQAVRVSFDFHEHSNGPQIGFLKEAIEYRREAGLPIPQGWAQGRVSWMTVEDFESTGLKGSVDSRTGDFWNYWLNFGLSNKGEKSRGGRGIGRVTFLIASTMTTVLGYTRRDDGGEYASGMTVLRAGQYGDDFRSTHAYLAKGEHGAIYDLHSENEFTDGFQQAFRLRNAANADNDTGLSLVIPYPAENLEQDGILASVIEHFGPAVLQGILEVTVGKVQLNAESLPTIARQCASEFSEPAIKDDPNRYVQLLRALVDPTINRFSLSLDRAMKQEVSRLADSRIVADMLEVLDDERPIAFDIEIPLTGIRGKTRSIISGVAMETTRNLKSIDMFFRDGMYLPLVYSRSTRGYDTILSVSDQALSDYLNLCEGKAHLDLLENQEVRAKLKAVGCKVTERRFVKALPDALRLLFVPEVNEPDATVFSDIFSVPLEDAPRRSRRSRPEPENQPPEPPNVVRKPTPFVLTDRPGGFRVMANAQFTEWPVALKMTLAYADGSKKPKWSKYDFDVALLRIQHESCELYRMEDNAISAISCNQDFMIDVSGFDINREIDIRIHRARNPATEDHA